MDGIEAKGNGLPVLVFAGGGTGGHLYPALAIANAWCKRLSNSRIVFYGTQRPVDRQIIGPSGYELVCQTLPPLRYGPWTWPATLRALYRAGTQCRQRFDRDHPAVVIGTGGLASFPAVRQARRAGIPTVLLNPDAIPGRANRHLAAVADRVFVQWEEATEHFKKGTKVDVMGCAVRPEFRSVSRSDGINHFGLHLDRKTLLVTGASQGARTVNQAAVAIIDFLESLEGWQVLHLTGRLDFEAVQEAYAGRSLSAKVIAYTEDMAHALAVADLVVSRAGASTLAEICAMGKPSVLMPYPFHRDMHQLANARCLSRASAACILVDAVDPAINGPALEHVLEPLMTSDRNREQMAAAACRIGRRNAASNIADALIELARQRGTLRAAETLEVSR
jgi:UDP-N-acetylglucosamine--N-acetylmuramyl-(pentapeptide) pyrophosphoryl-undecaprenol N-acetylglucosamine transferase